MRILLLCSFFISTSLLACPNLSGKYSSCQNANGEASETSEIMITQKTDRGITSYTMTSTHRSHSGETTLSETFRADGRAVTIRETDPDSGMIAEIVTTTSCQGRNSLVVSMKLTLDGEEMARTSNTVSKNGNSLVSVQRSSGPEGEISETTICR